MKLMRLIRRLTLAIMVLGGIVGCGGTPTVTTTASGAASSVAVGSAAASSEDAATSAEAEPSAATSAEAEPSAEAEASAAGGAGSSAGTIPLYTGAAPIDASSPIATVINAVKQQVQQQSGANATIEAYSLPSGTTFDQVKQFYTAALTAQGWQDVTANASIPAFSSGGTAGFVNSNGEIVTFLVIDNPIGGGSPILMVAQASAQN